MFMGYRFLFLQVRGRGVDAELREMVEVGGGECETFDIDEGRLKLRHVITKGKERVKQMTERGKGLVIVAEETLAIVGSDLWQAFLDEIRR